MLVVNKKYTAYPNTDFGPWGSVAGGGVSLVRGVHPQLVDAIDVAVTLVLRDIIGLLNLEI